MTSIIPFDRLTDQERRDADKVEHLAALSDLYGEWLRLFGAKNDALKERARAKIAWLANKSVENAQRLEQAKLEVDLCANLISMRREQQKSEQSQLKAP